MKKRTREKSPKSKWDFAIGTTSRVPNSSFRHYMIIDSDHAEIKKETLTYLRNLGAKMIVIQPTPNGWHIYTDLTYGFNQLLHLMPDCADKKWLKIGERRGYLFLADKSMVCFPWPVERMVIYNGQEKTHS